MPSPLVSIRDLSVRYRTREGATYAADGVSLDIERGRVLALVGESGSGKTTVGMSLLNLLAGDAQVLEGEVLFDGQDMLRMSDKDLRGIRGRRITMIFQDPIAGLNPVISIGDQVSELLTTHTGLKKKEAKARAIDVLRGVGLADPERVAKSYPFQLSGGMCQRVMIGIATALGPELIIADEPTAALDVTIQAQILHQLGELRRDRGSAILLITHDFGVVSQLADEVAVMYAGRVVERGTVRDVLASPLHPYTRALLATLPRIDAVREQLRALPGNPPDLSARAAHCAFLPRCQKAMQECRVAEPPSLVRHEGKGARSVACYNPVWQG